MGLFPRGQSHTGYGLITSNLEISGAGVQVHGGRIVGCNALKAGPAMHFGDVSGRWYIRSLNLNMGSRLSCGSRDCGTAYPVLY